METCKQVKGGRGKKAPYRTVLIRCPEPVKAAVMALIQQFHNGELPTPGADEEVSAVDANGKTVKIGDRVKILNGGLNSCDVGTVLVVGKNFLEIDIDQPSHHNWSAATGKTYKHSWDVVKVEVSTSEKSG